MTKLALAAVFAVATLTSFSVFPANAQQREPCTAGPQCPSQGSSEPYCGDQLGVLKRVLPAEVAGVDDNYRVWITEFCTGHTLMRSDGNAAYLRTTIADNDVLVEMLARRGLHAEDVFAVKMMGDDTINLFVHDFGR